MTFNADTLLSVRRAPTNRRIGKVRLGDIHSIEWRTQAGGTRSRFMAHPFVFGRILCTKVAEGRIAHSCKHGPPPHEVLVCMCQKDNPAALAAFIMHLANIQGAVAHALRESGTSHWLDVIDAVLAQHPQPSKVTRNLAGRGGKSVQKFAKRKSKRRKRRELARKNRAAKLARALREARQAAPKPASA